MSKPVHTPWFFIADRQSPIGSSLRVRMDDIHLAERLFEMEREELFQEEILIASDGLFQCDVQGVEVFFYRVRRLRHREEIDPMPMDFPEKEKLCGMSVLSKFGHEDFMRRDRLHFRQPRL